MSSANSCTRVGCPLADEQLDHHVEHFPLIILAHEDEVSRASSSVPSSASAARPCILWGLGAVRKSRTARVTLEELVGELYRRAAISFPDEDVLVAGRLAHPAAYSCSAGLDRRVPAAEVLAQR